MGLVAWVSRDASSQLPATAKADATLGAHLPVEAASPPQTHDSVTPGVARSERIEPSATVSELAAWLPTQTLSPVSAGGQTLFYRGIETAPLLVLEESDVSTQAVAGHGMSSEGAKLFELMMRAIKVPATHRKLCLLACDSVAGRAVTTACVQEMIYPDTRAVLYLSRRWESIHHCPTSEHHSRLVQSLLPVWRIPHPDVLLQRSDYKRQAWHCLQGLQSDLTS